LGCSFWGGEENGEKAPASWNTCWGVALYGYISKAEPRPKVADSRGISGLDAKCVFRFFHFAWVVFQRASLFLRFPLASFWLCTRDVLKKEKNEDTKNLLFRVVIANSGGKYLKFILSIP